MNLVYVFVENEVRKFHILTYISKPYVKFKSVLTKTDYNIGLKTNNSTGKHINNKLTNTHKSF